MGDVYLFLNALSFAFHILVVDHFSKDIDGVRLSCAQFLVAGILSLTLMLCFETFPTFTEISAAWPAIAYAGFMSCGVAYTLQIVAQKNMNPTTASIIMSLEAVFSAIGGVIILGQMMTPIEIVGCVIMFAATLIAQL